MPKAAVDRRIPLICLALIAGTFFAYGRVASYGFVGYDDFDYVKDNPHVTAGLTWPGIVWAFTTSHASNWHPLTWISLMLDCQVFGVRPGEIHFINLAFHIANSVLLFVLLRQMTGSLFRSGMVAALFAWHPLHVESVAWISERKDVLSAFFGLLSAMAYVSYARAPASSDSKRKLHFILALFWFALGLMAKPMLVTLPFVFLLLDYWPLARCKGSKANGNNAGPLSWAQLAVEKIPFFVLVAISCVVTLIVQRGAEASVQALPLDRRLANAVVACAIYLRKMVWPADLAIFYPMPGGRPLWQIVVAALALAGISTAALICARRRPWMLIGWLWFLGMLAPVIGIVQVGNQALADRYTYLPLVGVFIAIVWTVGDWAKQRRIEPGLLTVFSAAPLAACLIMTSIQAGYWRNTVILFRHDLAVVPDNATAHLSLGEGLDAMGRREAAMAELKIALQMDPKSALALNDVGLLYARAGNTAEAAKSYEASLRIKPADADANYNYGNLLAARGDYAAAAEHYATSVQSNPDGADAHNNYGVMLLQLERPAEAIQQFEAAIQLKPDHAETYDQLAEAELRLKQVNEAAANLQMAIQLKPEFAHPRLRLGEMLAQNGHLDEAKEQFQRVIALEPSNAEARYRLASVLEAQGQYGPAIDSLREAVQRRPNYVNALNALAYMLAAGPNAQFRNGPEAIQFAERACQLAGSTNVSLLATLDIAQAESGRFAEAIKTAQRVQELATAAGQSETSSNAAKRIELYRAGQPFHLPK